MSATGDVQPRSAAPRHGWERFRPGILLEIDQVETRIVMGPERLEFRLPTNTLPPGLEVGQSVWFDVSEAGLTPLWWESLEYDESSGEDRRTGWQLRPSDPTDERGFMARSLGRDRRTPSKVTIQSLG